MMPGMTGLEFCREFRDLDRESYGYFVLLTSKSEKTEIADGLEAGADDFLTKPVASNELRARLRAACQTGRSRKGKGTSEEIIDLLQPAAAGQLEEDRRELLVPVPGHGP